MKTTFPSRRQSTCGLEDYVRIVATFMGIFKFPRQFFRAIDVKFIHFAPAVFELGNIGGIQVKLLRHLHLAQTQAFSGRFEEFAFFQIS